MLLLLFSFRGNLPTHRLTKGRGPLAKKRDGLDRLPVHAKYFQFPVCSSVSQSSKEALCGFPASFLPVLLCCTHVFMPTGLLPTFNMAAKDAMPG